MKKNFYEYKVADYKVAKETEKAIGFEAWMNHSDNYRKSWEITFWVPKSIIKDGIIPAWFMSKKMGEYTDDFKNVVIVRA